MDALPVFVWLAGQRVVVVGHGDAADAKARLVVAAGGEVVREPPARLAFVALDDGDEAAAVAERLRATCLVNVVDRPDLCDFIVPAIVDRSPVIVAVGTGGASASLSKALRERFEALLPAGLGRLTAAIRAARADIASRAPTVAARRALWDSALAPGGPLDPLADHADPAAAIAALVTPRPANAVVTIALTSPDPDDLTLRQLRALAQADTIVAGADVPATIVDRGRRDAVRLTALTEPPPPGRTVVLTI